MPQVSRIAKPRAKRYVKKSTKQPGVGKLRGRGDYTYDKPGPWGRIGRSVGRMIGGAVGGNYGLGKAGSQVGEKLGSYAHYIGKIFGSGDYVTASEGVKTNSLVADPPLARQTPSFGSTKIRVKHREYLGDVYTHPTTPGAFNIQSFAINPGVANSYPWLSQVCGSTFQQYRINGQCYEFRSMSADALNSTNTALGTVVMCTDYDSKDNVFTSKQQMENTMFGVSCKPSSNMIHAIECARSVTAVSELYVRANEVPAGADPRLYDLGRFSIATQGGQAANINLGELWVTYDIDLFKPIEQPPGFLMPVSSYQLTGVDTTHSMGTARESLVDQIGLTFVSATEVTLPSTIEVGSLWGFYWNVAGDSTASVPQPQLTLSGGFVNYSFLVSSPYAGTSTTVGKAITVILKYNGGGTPLAPPKIAVANGVVPTNNSAGCFLSVFQVGSAFPG